MFLVAVSHALAVIVFMAVSHALAVIVFMAVSHALAVIVFYGLSHTLAVIVFMAVHVLYILSSLTVFMTVYRHALECQFLRLHDI